MPGPYSRREWWQGLATALWTMMSPGRGRAQPGGVTVPPLSGCSLRPGQPNPGYSDTSAATVSLTWTPAGLLHGPAEVPVLSGWQGHSVPGTTWVFDGRDGTCRRTRPS